MRLLFAGNPGIAVPALEALLKLSREEQGLELAGVLCSPDSAQGRSSRPVPTEVAAALSTLSPETPVLKPEKLDTGARRRVSALGADTLVSFAYGRIFGPKFLGLFPGAAFNIHPSLLPLYRGPTPLQAALLHRDTETGVTIQRIALGIDKGAIVMQEGLALSGRETTPELEGRAAKLAAEMLVALLKKLLHGEALNERVQEEEAATYCSLIKKEDGLIDWSKTALELDALIRAYNPWPLCLTRHGERDLYILEAAPLPSPHSEAPTLAMSPGSVLGKSSEGILVQTGEGVLALKRLQYRTKKALDWKSFLNGAPGFIGSVLK
jgi:methionyl-tRNA formyltransferase